MKREILTAFAVVLAASAFSQTANRAAAEKQILANEMAINKAFEKHDAAALNRLILPEGVSVDPMGVMNSMDIPKVLTEIKVSPGSKIDSSRVLWIDDNTAVHMYKWTGKGTAMGQPMPSPTWSSTLWVLRGGQWKATFHQETLAMTPPPSAPPAKK